MVVTAPVGHRFSAILANLAAFAVIGMVLVFSFERVPERSGAMHADIRLRLIQAGIPQKDKWLPELRDSHLDVVRRDAIARSLPKGSVLITGTPRRGSKVKGQIPLHNAIVSISSDNRIATLYDKVHLVPFGEYLPFRQALRILGLDKLAHGSVDFAPGKKIARIVNLPNLPAFRPLICYEIIFPREIIPTPHYLEPRWLLNVTNDAWFGDSLAPSSTWILLEFVQRNLGCL